MYKISIIDDIQVSEIQIESDRMFFLLYFVVDDIFLFRYVTFIVRVIFLAFSLAILCLPIKHQ